MTETSTDGEPIGRGAKNRAAWVWIVAAVILVVAGAVTWHKVLKEHVFPKRWGVVEEGLIYRSGLIPIGLARRVFEDKGLRLVVALNGSGKNKPDAEAALCGELGIEHHRFKLSGDGTGRIESYIEAVVLMHAAARDRKPMLVHCVAGSQRTGGAVAFYRLLLSGWAPQRVLEEMRMYDWDDDDVAVVDYVNTHMEAMVAALVERGVLDRAPRQLPQLTLER